VKIREIVAADLQAVWELNQSMVPAVGSVDIERMASLVELSEHAVLVESSDAKPAIDGFSLVFAPGSSYDSVNYLWFAAKYPTAHYLDRVAFRKSAQGQGFGSELYRDIEQRLIQSGVSELGLEVNVDPPNVQSLGFHKRHGYVEVGQQRTPYGTTVSMQLKKLA
jgi:predicted GNAT superfamily acetyltransferase